MTLMTLPKGYGQKTSTAGKRSFESWWATVPEGLRQKTRKGDEGNKPLLKTGRLWYITSPFSLQA